VDDWRREHQRQLDSRDAANDERKTKQGKGDVVRGLICYLGWAESRPRNVNTFFCFRQLTSNLQLHEFELKNS
jgi:hypothetical protein